MEPNTMKLVNDPKKTRYSPKALRLFHPVFLCRKLMMPSKKGAIARLRVKRSGRRKCCRVQKPAGVIYSEISNSYVGLQSEEL